MLSAGRWANTWPDVYSAGLRVSSNVIVADAERAGKSVRLVQVASKFKRCGEGSRVVDFCIRYCSTARVRESCDVLRCGCCVRVQGWRGAARAWLSAWDDCWSMR